MLMTTGAIVFGLALLLFASGVDAASRFGLGLVIASGMLTGTLFTMFVLPTVYVWLARDCDGMSERSSLSSAQRSAYHVICCCRGILFRPKICSPCFFIHQTSKSVNVNINNSHITRRSLYSWEWRGIISSFYINGLTRRCRGYLYNYWSNNNE
ncbi:hypothetical protein QL374_002589 [Salmonella enterica]|nr:hypothetical protein [Salmonella enterica]ELW6562310.1 hypothetical protein [Salmonella enterica]ELZ1403213.1 hypothetical protein [Salmonella enterica]